jgi:hypothetical protein
VKSIKCKVTHSRSKAAWNIVGTEIGLKYKIAIIPYPALGKFNSDINEVNRRHAFYHAEFICRCLNNAENIEVK